MSNYLLGHGTKATPQTDPIQTDQVQNNAGGFVWAVDCWTRLRRFLILGSEGGSYYATERKLTTENVTALRECIREDGSRTVDEIVAISDAGRAPKNDSALYALAACISLGDTATKKAAAEALPKVARIGTHLYHFVTYAETMRGWGRTLRWAVQNWYKQNPEWVALQGVKYRQRDGWTHRDVLRLAHPKSEAHSGVYAWLTGHETTEDLPAIIAAYEQAQASPNAAATARLVRETKLPREALNPEHLTDPDVWRALLEGGMPLTALTRNVANMTRVGALDRDHLQTVVNALGDADAIKKSRLHPMALLMALRTYTSGRGFRSDNTWNPIPDVADALDEAFYLAFDNVPATGKRHLLALDVSGSMGSGYVAGSNITPREASVAMALVTLHAEKDVEVMGFSTHFMPLGFSRRQRLDDAIRTVSHLPFAGTDCAIPMLYALQEQTGAEAFVTYTDSETWFGNIHPKQALDQYRNRTGIQARSVVVGMVANNFTIADPTDPGMLDVVGFDSAAPALIGEFVSGAI